MRRRGKMGCREEEMGCGEEKKKCTFGPPYWAPSPPPPPPPTWPGELIIYKTSWSIFWQVAHFCGKLLAPYESCSLNEKDVHSPTSLVLLRTNSDNLPGYLFNPHMCCLLPDELLTPWFTHWVSCSLYNEQLTPSEYQ